MEQYKIIKILCNILPIKDIKNIINEKIKITIHDKFIELDKLVNVFGDFETFINNQNINGNDMYIISNLSNYIDKQKISGNWIIICKLGYFNFIKFYIKYLCHYYKKRKDLNFIHRIYISIRKSNCNIFRIKCCIDINNYFKEKEKFDNQIKELFNTKQIDRIYIYKYK